MLYDTHPKESCWETTAVLVPEQLNVNIGLGLNGVRTFRTRTICTRTFHTRNFVPGHFVPNLGHFVPIFFIRQTTHPDKNLFKHILNIIIENIFVRSVRVQNVLHWGWTAARLDCWWKQQVQTECQEKCPLSHNTDTDSKTIYTQDRSKQTSLIELYR